MKYSFLLFIIVMSATQFLCLTKSRAQSTVNSEVFAEVITVITARQTAQLNFGKFTPATQGGQVLITPEGSRMSTGTVILSQGSHHAAGFLISGEEQSTFSITLPTGPSTITNVSNSKTMIVDGWVSIPAQGIGQGILEGGVQEIKVGATLSVGSMEDNPVGIYSGTYQIKFDYN